MSVVQDRSLGWSIKRCSIVIIPLQRSREQTTGKLGCLCNAVISMHDTFFSSPRRWASMKSLVLILHSNALASLTLTPYLRLSWNNLVNYRLFFGQNAFRVETSSSPWYHKTLIFGFSFFFLFFSRYMKLTSERDAMRKYIRTVLRDNLFSPHDLNILSQLIYWCFFTPYLLLSELF